MCAVRSAKQITSGAVITAPSGDKSAVITAIWDTGMDIISLGDFRIQNQNGNSVFTFRW